MNTKNFTPNFKKLTIRLGLAMAATLVIVGITEGLLHLSFWNYWWTIATAIIAGAGLAWGPYSERKVAFWVIALLFAAPSAVLAYTLFYTAQQPEQIASLADYDHAKDRHRYVDFDNWYYNVDHMGVVEITTTTTRRRGGSSTSKRVYVAVPLYADSTSTDPKIWMALDFSTSRYDAIETEEELIRFDDILCFEKLAPSLVEDFRSAIDYCDSDSLKSLRSDAVFITPLYEPFVTTGQWAIYSLYVLLGSVAVLALMGLFIREPAGPDSSDNEPQALSPENATTQAE